MSEASARRGAADEIVTSLANPALKYARSLHRRRVREREQALLVEGTRAILTALDHGATIRVLFLDASRVAQLDPAMLARLRQAAERVVTVANLAYLSIAETEHPQAVIAICAAPALPLPRAARLVLALADVRDPGNLGTLVRAAAGAGADAVALLPGCVDPFNAKAVRASAGLIFALPVRAMAILDDIAGAMFDARPRIALADASGTVPYYLFDWTAETILLLGGEAAGAGSHLRGQADSVVAIPMAAGVESLNVAMAGTVLLFEAARQRATATMPMG